MNRFHSSVVALTTVTFASIASSAMAASVQVGVTGCGSTTYPVDGTVDGEWGGTTEAQSGNGGCRNGATTFGGDGDTVYATANATATSDTAGVIDQSRAGARTFSTYQFRLESTGGTEDRAVVTFGAQLSGSYSIDAEWNGQVASGTAVGIISGNMYVGSIIGQVEYYLSDRVNASTFPRIMTDSDSGIVDELLSTSSYIDVGALFDVRIVADAFSSVSAGVNSTSSGRGDAASRTDARMTLAFADVPDGYCIRGIDTSFGTCGTGPGDGDGGGGPVEPGPGVSEVPLPMSGLLLAGGIGLLAARRRVAA